MCRLIICGARFNGQNNNIPNLQFRILFKNNEQLNLIKILKIIFLPSVPRDIDKKIYMYIVTLILLKSF